jgi:[ribosomal protein S18]-alanine N-acetyltransferase
VDLALRPFDEAHASEVLAWARTPEEAEQWASVPFLRLRPSLFREWHTDPDVTPYVALLAGEPSAYGEVWDDHEENEAELGRIIVAPRRRGFGVGRRFVSLLVAEAVTRGFSAIWVRVRPGNAAAEACYRAAGFVRTTPAQEDTFNLDQPRVYAWMRHTGDA